MQAEATGQMNAFDVELRAKYNSAIKKSVINILKAMRRKLNEKQLKGICNVCYVKPCAVERGKIFRQCGMYCAKLKTTGKPPKKLDQKFIDYIIENGILTCYFNKLFQGLIGMKLKDIPKFLESWWKEKHI